jgi:hypothetical protein
METTRFSVNYTSTAWYDHTRFSIKGTLNFISVKIMALSAPEEDVLWELTKGIIFSVMLND